MLNHVVLMGRLTADPELHMIDAETQKCVCNVVIACERKKKEQVDFIRCVAWNNRAKFLWEWFRKGSMIALEGMLRTRSYEKDGKRCFTMEVLAENIYYRRKIKAVHERNGAFCNTGYGRTPRGKWLEFRS